MVTEPSWLKVARDSIGMREIPGPEHNATIVDWWKGMGAPFRDDETAWCGAFLDHCLRAAGEEVVDTGQVARNWLKLPVTLDEPAVGSIAVLWRESPTSWKGHAGFLVGKDSDGNPLVLGGNQDDGVNVKAFPASQVLGYRWPSGQPDPELLKIPTFTDEQVAAWNTPPQPAPDLAAPSVPESATDGAVAETAPNPAASADPVVPAATADSQHRDVIVVRTTRSATPESGPSQDEAVADACAEAVDEVADQGKTAEAGSDGRFLDMLRAFVEAVSRDESIVISSDPQDGGAVAQPSSGEHAALDNTKAPENRKPFSLAVEALDNAEGYMPYIGVREAEQDVWA
ncbi:TIGR02594 family protein [Chelatococcus sp. GCM10030263]|uniref:TIGR02594 family protein n=1 Tax=Chelatococcus sp. GCM10030263 TaxID=3273387 RepID=UPI00362013FB